jgi:hypothetical protein
MEKMTVTELNTIKYLCNPDVVLREEDEDGCLLFNPDTNQVKILNATGLFIWKQFSNINELAHVVVAVQETFDEVPAKDVQTDVKEFLNGMVENGFIGVVEEKK